MFSLVLTTNQGVSQPYLYLLRMAVRDLQRRSKCPGRGDPAIVGCFGGFGYPSDRDLGKINPQPATYHAAHQLAPIPSPLDFPAFFRTAFWLSLSSTITLVPIGTLIKFFGLRWNFVYRIKCDSDGSILEASHHSTPKPDRKASYLSLPHKCYVSPRYLLNQHGIISSNS